MEVVSATQIKRSSIASDSFFVYRVIMLYRKYRPQVFAQVVGQEHVVKTLKGALMTGRIGYAYLFTGPRGTGKTTLARIFAKALNCAKIGKDGDPDNSCPSCVITNEGRSMDLIEIDAASNRGIEDIRNLKESALVSAPSGGYKVFVIDEVHMLTKDAFNALLKILEEPPSHVVFVLATTEPHKILPTVLSRVQRFDFRRLTPSQIFTKLKEVAKAEKINIEDEGLKAISVSSDGALRDAEVSLSKLRSHQGKIDIDDVTSALGLVSFKYHPEFFGYLVANDKVSALKFIQKIHESGVDLEHFTKDFIEYIRNVLMFKINPATLTAMGEEPVQNWQIEGVRLVKMLNVFVSARNEIKTSPIVQLPLELAVLELTD